MEAVWQTCIAPVLNTIGSFAIFAHSYGGAVAMELIVRYPTHFEDKCFAIALSDSVHGTEPEATANWLQINARHYIASSQRLNTPEHNFAIELYLSWAEYFGLTPDKIQMMVQNGSVLLARHQHHVSNALVYCDIKLKGMRDKNIDYVVIDIVVAEHVRELLENSLKTGADSLPWKHLRLWNRKNLSSTGFDFHIAIASVYRSLTHGTVTKLDKLGRLL